MKIYIRCVLSVATCVMLSAVHSSQATAVETFTCDANTAFVVPGNPDGTGYEFDVHHCLTSLTFTPGSVLFDGRKVDLAGTEARFLQARPYGTVEFPVASGPATVDASSVFRIPQLTGWRSEISLTGIQLDSSFSISNPLLMNGSIPFDIKVGPWNSQVSKDLAGANLSISGTINILSIDPLSCCLQTRTTGTIWASLPATCSWYCGHGINVATDGFEVISPPILGKTFQATVKHNVPGSTTAILYGYAAPGFRKHRLGEILVDYNDPAGELLGAPVAVGDPAYFNIPVPYDPSLLGYALYTQAVSITGGQKILHCAFECHLGYQ